MADTEFWELEALPYQPRGAAATHCLRVDLHGRSWHAVSDQGRGDGLRPRQAEFQRGGLAVRTGIRGVAVAGHRNQTIAAFARQVRSNAAAEGGICATPFAKMTATVLPAVSGSPDGVRLAIAVGAGFAAGAGVAVARGGGVGAATGDDTEAAAGAGVAGGETAAVGAGAGTTGGAAGVGAAATLGAAGATGMPVTFAGTGGAVGNGGRVGPTDSGAGGGVGSGSGLDATAPTGALPGGVTGALGCADVCACAGDDGGAGGAFAAGNVADAAGAAPGAGAGPGGGVVPTPNRSGDALGDEGSPSGAAAAIRCAFARSATSASAIF